MEEKGIVGGECFQLETRGAEVPKRCPGTIPFSSLSWFSLLHIDEDVEEPGTSENPTRSFEIHNIGSHIFWRLYILYDIDIYVGYMIIFRYRAPGLPCVLEYLQNTAIGCVRLAIAIHPL